MPELAQVHAVVPRALKRQVFSVLALRDERFSPWLRQQMERWLATHQTTEEPQRDRLVGSETCR